MIHGEYKILLTKSNNRRGISIILSTFYRIDSMFQVRVYYVNFYEYIRFMVYSWMNGQKLSVKH